MEEQFCENCCHCRRYYVRYRLHFSPTAKGDCARKRNKVPLENVFTQTCAHWESRWDEEDKIRKELAKRSFAAVYERIDELISLIKDK